VLDAFSKEMGSLKDALNNIQSQVPNQTDFASLAGELASLRLAYSSLQENLHSQPPAPIPIVHVSSPSPSSVQYVVSESMPLPEKFSGARKSYTVSNFKLAVRRVLDNMPTRFNDDASRIKFIGNLLEGAARKWFDHIEMAETDIAFEILNNLECFWMSLEKHFGHKSLPFANEIELLKLEQGNTRISEFNIRFKQLAAALDFNESALCAIYIKNLNDETVNFLKRTPPIPRKLDEIMERCAHLDSGFLASRSFVPRAMQVDAVSRAEDKKLFCPYCKMRDHSINSCPKLARKNEQSSGQGKVPATRL